MMKLKLVAIKPEKGTREDLIVDEKYWRPARSLMAIANQKIFERSGQLVEWVETLGDLDENTGCGIESDGNCTVLAEEMEELMKDPFAISDYGMSVDIDDGEVAYTYPNTMCTAYLEDADTGEFYESLESPGILGKRVRSWFRTPEDKMQEIIAFMKSCGGFRMP